MTASPALTQVRIRPYTPADTAVLRAIQAECFPPPFPSELWWTAAQIASHHARFPEGALLAEVDGQPVGSATSLRVHLDPAHLQHTWSAISADGMLTTHDPQGETLYGVDIAVRPAFRGRGVARALYQARFALVRCLGLARFAAGSRLAGYGAHTHLTPEAYAAEVVAGRLIDPVITPQLRAGLRPWCVLHDYLPDHEARNCAVLMVWDRPEVR